MVIYGAARTGVAASQSDYTQTHRSGSVRTIIRHYSTAVRKVTLQGSRVAFHDSKNTDQLAKILNYSHTLYAAVSSCYTPFTTLGK